RCPRYLHSLPTRRSSDLAFADKLGGEAQIVELATVLPSLATGGFRPSLGTAAQDALEAVETADVLVVGSPAYRATYSGLFKLFLDRKSTRLNSSHVKISY